MSVYGAFIAGLLCGMFLLLGLLEWGYRRRPRPRPRHRGPRAHRHVAPGLGFPERYRW